MIIRRQFSDEFREDAVMRARKPGAIISQVAAEVDVSNSVLRRWMKEHGKPKQYKRNKPTYQHPIQPQTGGLAAVAKAESMGEVARLREALAQMTAERDLLKKTLAHYLGK